MARFGGATGRFGSSTAMLRPGRTDDGGYLLHGVYPPRYTHRP